MGRFVRIIDQLLIKLIRRNVIENNHPTPNIVYSSGAAWTGIIYCGTKTAVSWQNKRLNLEFCYTILTTHKLEVARYNYTNYIFEFCDKRIFFNNCIIKYYGYVGYLKAITNL